MEYTITWGGDPEHVCLTARGVARLGDLDAMLWEAVADPRWVDGMKVLLDYTQMDWRGLEANELRRRADQVRQTAVRIGRQRIAAAVASESLPKVRLLGLLLDREVDYVGQSFTSVSEAREWLRQPPDDSLPHTTARP